MKRSGPPKRNAPLKSGSTLKRSSPGTKAGKKPRIRTLAVDDVPKTERDHVTFKPSVKRIVRRRSRGWCEMPGCTRAATAYHHRKMRSAGGLGLVENCLHLCAEDHAWVHDHPEVSYGHGALLRRHMVDHPDPVFHPGWRSCTTDHVHGGVDTAA